MDKRLSLHVEPAEGTPFSREVKDDSIVIGRSSSSDLPVRDRSLSRRHARLYLEGDIWFLEDLGSRNGTMLSSVRVTVPTPVQAGAIIRLGGSTVTIKMGGGAASRPEQEVEGSWAQSLFRPASDMLQESSSAEAERQSTQDGTLGRFLARLRLLNEVHQALGQSISQDELLELILERAFEHLKPEEGAIFLRQGDGFVCSASRSLTGDGHISLHSRRLLHEVAEKGQAALVLDTAADVRFQEAASLLSAGLQSLVAAPLLDGKARTLGMIVLASTLNVRQFQEGDMELLVSLASIAAMRIRNVRLTEAAAERQRLEQEIALSRQIQVALLPDCLPDFPGYDLHGGNLPSQGASGDIYKILTRADGEECVMLLADVSGKGIPAAVLTASLEALSASPIESGLPPREICAQVSRMLCDRTRPEKFATAFLAVVQKGTGRIEYVNAGHNAALLVRASGEWQWLESTGLPLGVLPDCDFPASSVSLEPGDLLAVYSDGITEALDPDDEEYGPERLQRILVDNREASLKSVAESLEIDLERFSQGIPFADDRTLVLIRREHD